MKRATLHIITEILLIAVLLCLPISSALAADTALSRTLRIGMSGEDVAVVQQLLKNLGYYSYSKITGYFGTITDGAVRTFQRANGLVVDGIVGPATRGVMNKLLQSSPVVHVARSGDTMWKISQYYGVPLDALLYENGMSVSDGSMIYVGQKIYIPKRNIGDSGGPYVRYISHVVAKGEYLWLLSYKYGVPVQEIADANGITTSTVLYVGQTIKIPQHVVPVKSTPGSKYGELLDWWTEAQYVFPLGAIATVEDFETGICYNVKRTYGLGHADVEPLTAQDTKIMQGIWEKYEVLWDGSVNYWARRPVIIHIGGRKLAASASGMFHAGVDSVPNGGYAYWRSGGYGPGTNFDSIKGNGADGHSDIHFLNSVRHKDGQVDEQHQAMIRLAAGK